MVFMVSQLEKNCATSRRNKARFFRVLRTSLSEEVCQGNSIETHDA
jgi:hypothetical protein